MKTRSGSFGLLIPLWISLMQRISRRLPFSNLKPSIKSISIRLPEDLLAELKILANKKDVPYQSLAKVFLARQIVLERESLARSSRKRKVKTASRSK